MEGVRKVRNVVSLQYVLLAKGTFYFMADVVRFL